MCWVKTKDRGATVTSLPRARTVPLLGGDSSLEPLGELVRASLGVSGPAGCLCLEGCRLDWLRLPDLPALWALREGRA